MTKEQIQAIQSLRSEGYAVTVFTPDELQGADTGQVEDVMVERGWNAINDLKERS